MAIIHFIIDMFRWVIDKLKYILEALIDKFLEINIFEKLIIISTAAALFAIILPIASHNIFNLEFPKHNPLAVYLIGIVFIMQITIIFPGFITFIIRLLINSYYYFWVLYMHYGEGIMQTEYKLLPGYYMNISVPMIYVLLSIFSYLRERNN